MIKECLPKVDVSLFFVEEINPYSDFKFIFKFAIFLLCSKQPFSIKMTDNAIQSEISCCLVIIICMYICDLILENPPHTH